MAAFIAFLVVAGILVWIIRMIVMSRRFNRLSKAQYDVHSKLLDRFTSNEDLLAYMQTAAGRRFLEAAPVRLPEEPQSVAAPSRGFSGRRRPGSSCCSRASDCSM